MGSTAASQLCRTSSQQLSSSLDSHHPYTPSPDGSGLGHRIHHSIGPLCCLSRSEKTYKGGTVAFDEGNHIKFIVELMPLIFVEEIHNLEECEGEIYINLL